jgi:hypothetical protein
MSPLRLFTGTRMPFPTLPLTIQETARCIYCSSCVRRDAGAAISYEFVGVRVYQSEEVDIPIAADSGFDSEV